MTQEEIDFALAAFIAESGLPEFDGPKTNWVSTPDAFDFITRKFEYRSAKSATIKGTINLIKKQVDIFGDGAAILWRSRPRIAEDAETGDEVVKSRWLIIEAPFAKYFSEHARLLDELNAALAPKAKQKAIAETKEATDE